MKPSSKALLCRSAKTELHHIKYDSPQYFRKICSWPFSNAISSLQIRLLHTEKLKIKFLFWQTNTKEILVGMYVISQLKIFSK